MGSREIARTILVVNEQDPRDRRLLTERMRRVSKALRVLRGEGVARSSHDNRGNMVWARKGAAALLAAKVGLSTVRDFEVGKRAGQSFGACAAPWAVAPRSIAACTS
jgi:hypothetical protein